MIIQISAGIHPPEECKEFVDRFYNMILNSIDSEADILQINYDKGTDRPRSVLLYSDLDLSKYIGSNLWIWKSKIRPGHKRKNWYIDISEIEEVKEEDYILDESLFEWTTFRSGGPGGQHVNKTSSGVRLKYKKYITESTSERSQHQNKSICKKKMLAILKSTGELKLANRKDSAWKKHNNIVRGNPVNTFIGDEFKLKSNTISLEA